MVSSSRQPLLHHAESVADVSDERRMTYRMPTLQDGRRVWQTFTEIGTSDAGAFPHTEGVGEEDPFEVIARQALAAGRGGTARVANADSYSSTLSGSRRLQSVGSRTRSASHARMHTNSRSRLRMVGAWMRELW
jgi:hypothetical protein